MNIIRPRYAVAIADLFALLLLVMVMLPHFPDQSIKTDSKAPGAIIVEIRWPDGLSSDIDLWVKAPGRPVVGYSNPSDAIFNLLRDDLGTENDPLLLNYENAYSRSAPNGEYIVNLFYYSGRPVNVPVDVVVWLKPKDNEKAILIHKATVIMTKVNTERTVLRFSIHNLSLVPDSVNDLEFKFFSKKTKTPPYMGPTL